MRRMMVSDASTVFVVLIATLAMVFCGAVTTAADPIIVIKDAARLTAVLPFVGSEQSHTIEAGGSDAVMSTITAPPPAAFRGTSTATLTSSIADPLHWSAVGSGTVSLSEVAASTDSASSYAAPIFSVVFEVTAPVGYVFDGVGTTFASLAADPDGPFSFAGAVSFGHLSMIVVPGEDPVLRSIFSFTTPGSHRVRPTSGAETHDIHPAFVGVLGPGEYWLRLDAGGSAGIVGSQPGSGDATGTFAFTLDFTPAESPVPEPSSVVLLAMGVVGLVARRRLKSMEGPEAKRLREHVEAGDD